MPRKFIFLLCIIFIFLFRISFANKLSVGYERIPDVGEILDERINVLSGITFAKTGIPTGWSNLSSYFSREQYHHINSILGFNGLQVTKDHQDPSLTTIQFFHYPIVYVKEVNLMGEGARQVSFVQPFFDHSPLAGLLYMQSVKDKTSIEKLDPSQYRFIPTYVLFWFNAVLFFLVTYLLTKRFLPALLAFLIYTTSPSFVISARLTMLENTLIPLTLLTLLFLILYRDQKLFKKKAVWLLVCSGITAGLALATKESGVGVFFMSIALLLYYKTPKKLFKYFLIPAFLIGAFFYVYFFILSPSLAWGILVNQTGRGFFGPLNFLYSIKQLSFHNFPLDGYWLFGFLSIFLLFREKGNNQEIIYGFLATLVTFLFFAGLNYPWYSLTFIPFLVLASALFIESVIVEPNFFKLLIFFAIPFSSSFYWGYVARRDISSVLPLYRLFLGGFIIFYFLAKINKKPYQIMISVVCLVMFLWNIQSIGFIVEHWGKLPSLFSMP